MRFPGILAAAIVCCTILAGCSDDTPDTGPQLVFTFRFDPDQARLNNLGQPADLPVGHAAQTPDFRAISANYIELAPGPLTLLGQGEIVFEGAETTQGGARAIDFSKAIVVDEGETFLSVPLADVTPGTYEWLRVSLAYQQYVILADAETGGFSLTDVPCTVASFVGYNTYIASYRIQDETVTVNGNKLQGYAGVETEWSLHEVQAPPGATTVPNPLFNTSPIPPGSCVVTGAFPESLVITGQETEDIVVEMSLSVNQSFEWEDGNGNGKYEPLLDEKVVDMGLRGLIPVVK